MFKLTALWSWKRLKNPHALDKSFLDSLSGHFSQVDAADADVAQRMIRFVVDGTDSEVVLELASRPAIGKALRLHQEFIPKGDQAWKLSEKKLKEREKFLWPKGQVAPEAWMRLGQAFEALFLAGNVKAAILPTWPGWLKSLFGMVQSVTEDVAQKGYWSLNRWEPILELAALPTDTLARLLLDSQQYNSLSQLSGTFVGYVNYVYRGKNLIEQTTGWREYLGRYQDTVREVLQTGDAASRTHALSKLLHAEYDFTPILDVVVGIACGGAKTPRELALAALETVSDSARPLLESMLGDGDTSQRHEAALALWRLFGADARKTLEKHAKQETSERVQQTIAKLIAAPTEDSVDATAFEFPPVSISLGHVPLGGKARDELCAFIEKTYTEHQENYEKALSAYHAADPKGYRYKPHQPPTITAKEIGKFLNFVEKNDEPQKIHASWKNKPFEGWFAPPNVQLVHVVRLAYGLQHLGTGHGGRFYWRNTQNLEAYRERSSPKFGLRELDVATMTLPEVQRGEVLRNYLNSNGKYWTFCNWEPEAVWPAFAENLDILREPFGPSPNIGANYQTKDYGWSTRRENAFKVLAMFPRLPPGFIPLLWDLALGDGKSDRLPAQQALASVADKPQKIVVALEDGKQVVRAAAAEWLGRLGDKNAIEPLKETFTKEKQEFVKGAILGALDALGADVKEFLDRKKLLKESQAGLAKKKPKGMEWVPLESIPELHWQDTGKRVDPAIIQRWVIQSIAQKLPVAGPLLRRYLQMCRPTEANSLARWALRSWIGADTEPLSHDEAAARATKATDQQWQWASNNSFYQNYFQERYQGKKENLYQELYNGFRATCKGSAINEKGILALVSAAGDTDCVKLAEQYIRNWFGNRVAQCKALIEVLAWLDHPTAIQVLLSIGNRFRTKSIREAAAEHVKALAERQGWTLDELADRTLPDAGFERPTDDEGRPVGDEAKLVLDYGSRTFTVTLNDELEPVVTTEEGKTVKAPPAPGKNDDAEKAKEAKKRFSDAKKNVKQVIKTQKERLYESMCTQRRWRFDDWQRYLAQHPIVGRLCCRVIWGAFDERWEDEKVGTFRGCFRPLDDGSLTNEKDEAVQWTPNTVLRVAHTCNVSPESELAWKQHLADYDVEPLICQFGRQVFALPKTQRNDTELKEFEGYALSNFKLRGKATKLGYLRGPAEDGGWFHLYRKPFGSLEIEAILGFTGSGLPEEDRTVALLSLTFQRLKQGGNPMGYFENASLALEKVPPVLLSECYNDIKQIAAEGSGFDPDWNKKSYW